MVLEIGLKGLECHDLMFLKIFENVYNINEKDYVKNSD